MVVFSLKAINANRERTISPKTGPCRVLFLALDAHSQPQPAVRFDAVKISRPVKDGFNIAFIIGHLFRVSDGGRSGKEVPAVDRRLCLSKEALHANPYHERHCGEFMESPNAAPPPMDRRFSKAAFQVVPSSAIGQL